MESEEVDAADHVLENHPRSSADGKVSDEKYGQWQNIV